MNKTPSFLKGLGARRARAEGQVLRLEALQARIAEELERTKEDLASYDRVIRLAHPELDPTKIPAIRGGRVPTKGDGKKESIEEAVLKILGAEPDASRSTMELAVQLVARLRLDFKDEKEFGEWAHNSIARRLKKMAAVGSVVRLHDPIPGGDRWMVEAT